MTEPATAPRYVVVLADSDGFVQDIDEALAHLHEHQPDDEPCDECPMSLSIRTGSALPSPPDEQGLNSRLPGSWRSADLLLEDDRLHYEDGEDVVARLEGAKVLRAALAAAAERTAA